MEMNRDGKETENNPKLSTTARTVSMSTTGTRFGLTASHSFDVARSISIQNSLKKTGAKTLRRNEAYS